MTLLRRPSARRNAATMAVALGLVLAALGAAGPKAHAATLDDLCGPLRLLAEQAQAGGVNPAALRAAGLTVLGNRVQVEIFFGSEAARRAASLAPYGAAVLSARDRRILALVPADQLAAVARIGSVATVRPPFPLELLLPGTGPTLSQGVQLTNALSFQLQSGIGTGVKVAIIDTGFMGYPTAELPPGVQTKSFRADGVVDGITEHGTACGEVVADMAPGAVLYLLAVDTEMTVEDALDFCAANGIQVISISLGYSEGPFDGTGAMDTTLDRARATGAAGIFPAVAAGNHAMLHWAGPWQDRDRNGVGEFKGSAETLDIGLSDGTTQLPAGSTVQMALSWWETAGPTGGRADVTDRDYDLVLISRTTGQVVARSAFTQNGNDPPAEQLVAIIPAVGTYGVQIWAVSSNIAGGPTDSFHLFITQGYQISDTTLRVPESSLLSPGTATGAVTVAATRADATVQVLPAIPTQAVDSLETFSSWGPRTDGLAKPQLSGPDGVATSLATLNPFFGTSAAAPHVAGAAALLLGEDGSRTTDQIESVLLRLAAEQNQRFPVTLADGSTPADQFQCGAGRLTLRAGLDTRPPTIFISFPENGTTVTTTTPTVLATIQDAESGVNVSTIVLTLDGVPVQYDSFEPTSGVLTFTPTSPLSRAAHTLTLAASDNAGNVADPATCNFRVSLPTISAGLHLITVPYRNLVSTDPGVIFGTETSAVGLVRWVPTDSAFDKYHVYPDALATFEPSDAIGSTATVISPPAGLGYFVSLPTDCTVNAGGEPLTDVASYQIRVRTGTVAPKGWNLIGNPFLDDVDFASVQFIVGTRRIGLDDAINEGVTEGVLYEFVPATGTTSGHYSFVDPLAGVLEANKGYWLHVNENAIVEVYPAGVSTASAAQVVKRLQAHAPQWRAQLTATAGKLVDVANYIGMSRSATDGYDSFSDVPEPPWMPEGVRLYFPHADWGNRSGNYAQDIVPEGGKAIWPVEVSCSTPGAKVQLHWPNLNEVVPGDVRLTLRDTDSGRAVAMRDMQVYSFRAGTEPRHLVIEATTGQRAVIVTAMSAEAGRGSAVVTYTLTQAATVTVEVRNIAGRPVKQVRTDALVAAGTNTAAWDLTNQAGVRVPAGRYMISLTARAEDGSATNEVRLLDIRP